MLAEFRSIKNENFMLFYILMFNGPMTIGQLMSEYETRLGNIKDTPFSENFSPAIKDRETTHDLLNYISIEHYPYATWEVLYSTLPMDQARLVWIKEQCEYFTLHENGEKFLVPHKSLPQEVRISQTKAFSDIINRELENLARICRDLFPNLCDHSFRSMKPLISSSTEFKNITLRAFSKAFYATEKVNFIRAYMRLFKESIAEQDIKRIENSITSFLLYQLEKLIKVDENGLPYINQGSNQNPFAPKKESSADTKTVSEISALISTVMENSLEEYFAEFQKFQEYLILIKLSI